MTQRTPGNTLGPLPAFVAEDRHPILAQILAIAFVENIHLLQLRFGHRQKSDRLISWAVCRGTWRCLHANATLFAALLLMDVFVYYNKRVATMDNTTNLNQQWLGIDDNVFARLLRSGRKLVISRDCIDAMQDLIVVDRLGTTRGVTQLEVVLEVNEPEQFLTLLGTVITFDKFIKKGHGAALQCFLVLARSPMKFLTAKQIRTGANSEVSELVPYMSRIRNVIRPIIRAALPDHARDCFIEVLSKSKTNPETKFCLALPPSAVTYIGMS